MLASFSTIWHWVTAIVCVPDAPKYRLTEELDHVREPIQVAALRGSIVLQRSQKAWSMLVGCHNTLEEYGVPAVSLWTPQKIYLVAMGVMPLESNDMKRGRGYLENFRHPKTGKLITEYPINRMKNKPCTPDEMLPYCNYINEDAVWKDLVDLAPDRNWEATWKRVFKHKFDERE